MAKIRKGKLAGPDDPIFKDSTALQDDATFDQLSALILFFSDGTIEFESTSQMVGTNAMCGLLPQLRNFAD